MIIRKPAPAILRRRLILWSYAVLLLVVLLATAVFVIMVFVMSNLVLDDKLAIAGDAAAGGTLLLAAVAGLVALQAYAVSTGLPDLRIQVWFANSEKNQPVFRAEHTADGCLEVASPPGQTIATIRILNHGDYSANNPAVIIWLRGLSFDLPASNPDWAVLDSGIRGVTATQWDGGPMYSIHGGSARRLPLLDFSELRYLPTSEHPLLTVELLADGGYRRTVDIGVRFKTIDREYGSQEPYPPTEWL